MKLAGYLSRYLLSQPSAENCQQFVLSGRYQAIYTNYFLQISSWLSYADTHYTAKQSPSSYLFLS